MTPYQQLENRVRQLETLIFSLIKSDKLVISRDTYIQDGRNIVASSGTGTSFGSSATEKVGFHGKATAQHAALTALSETGTDSDATARAGVNAINAVLKDKGLTA